MLQLRETRIVRSSHAPILSTAIIPEEGIALVYEKEDGETKVKPSTGAPGEIFAGVSVARNVPPGQVPNYESGVLDATLSVRLARTPIANQLLVKVAGVQVTVVAGAPANNTEVGLAGNVLTFFAGENGKSFAATYLYAPTTVEARTCIGDAPVGGLASAELGIIGRLLDAQFGTSFFDASVDWSGALYAKLGANGNFTVGTPLDHIPNVTVMNTPNANNPFLVLSINVG